MIRIYVPAIDASGKKHRYCNIVENKRCAGGKVVQRQMLYLGEINDGQCEAWCQLIDAFAQQARHHPDARCSLHHRLPHADPEPLYRTNTDQKLLVKQVKLDLLSLPPPRITAPAGRPTLVVPRPV